MHLLIVMLFTKQKQKQNQNSYNVYLLYLKAIENQLIEYLILS